MKTAVSYRSYRLLWYFRRLFGRQLDLPVLVGSFSPTKLMTHNPVVVHSHDNLHHVPCLFGPSLLFQRLLKGKVKKQEACSRLSRLRLSWAIFYPLAVCAYNGKWSQRSINANFVLTSFAGSGSSFLDFLRLLGSSDQWISHSTAGSRLKIRRGWSCKISSSNRSSSCWWDQQPTQKLRTNLVLSTMLYGRPPQREELPPSPAVNHHDEFWTERRKSMAFPAWDLALYVADSKPEKWGMTCFWSLITFLEFRMTWDCRGKQGIPSVIPCCIWIIG